MAVINYPMSMAVVKGLRHTADFYFQRGRQVARWWPKKSNLVPTPKQKIQRDNFRAIECTLKSQGQQQRTAWQDWQPYNGQTWVDYLHRVWIGPAFRGTLFTMWDWSDWHVRENIGDFNRLRIFWDPEKYPDTHPFDVFASPLRSDGRKWPWGVYDYKIQRGRYRQARWTPKIDGGIRLHPSNFSQGAGNIGFDVPKNWLGCLFAALPSSEPDDKSLVTACHIAPWSPR